MRRLEDLLMKTRITTLLLIFVLVSIFSAFQPNPIALAREQAQVSTRTPTPSPTPTITPTPTRKPAPTPTPTRGVANAFDFKEIVVGGGGGGGGIFCIAPNEFDPAERQGEFPLIHLNRTMQALEQHVTLCFYGFPQGEPLEVKIFSPDNTQVLKTLIPVNDEGVGYTTAGLAMPVFDQNIPQGRWRVTARSGDVRAEGSFQVPGPGQFLSVKRVVPGGTNPLDPRRSMPPKPGGVALVQGANFPPNSDFPVGLYQAPDGFFGTQRLIAIQMVRTDRNGLLQAGFQLDNSVPEGIYSAIVFQDPNQKELEWGSPNADRFTIRKPWQACPGAMLSNIKEGDTAFLSTGSPNNLREKAGLDSKKIGQLQPLTWVFITKGPKCADGMVWWKIETVDGRLKGWTAEGQKNEFWLVPNL